MSTPHQNKNAKKEESKLLKERKQRRREEAERRHYEQLQQAENRSKYPMYMGMGGPLGHPHTDKSNICCLIERNVKCGCNRSNASYSTRIQNMVRQHNLPYERDPSVGHNYICDFHKKSIQAARVPIMKEKAESSETGPTLPIDFSGLQAETLIKITRKLNICAESTESLDKAELTQGQFFNHYPRLYLLDKVPDNVSWPYKITNLSDGKFYQDIEKVTLSMKCEENFRNLPTPSHRDIIENFFKKVKGCPDGPGPSGSGGISVPVEEVRVRRKYTRRKPKDDPASNA